MKRRTFLKRGALITVGLSSSPLFFPKFGESLSKKQEKTSTSREKDLQVLVLDGAPRKRGQRHGEALRPMIKEVIEGWKDFLHSTGHVNPDQYINRFLEETNFLLAIKKWTPDLLEETKGIGEGAGIDFKTIYAFQLMDEEWLFGRKTILEKSSTKAHHCSGLGAFNQGDYPAIQAQNMDIPGYSHGFQALLHIKHPNSSLESLVFTYVGLIILNGINNRPVSVCCNTLSQLNYSIDGLPVAFVLRGILDQSSQEDAVKFIHKIKHASGQNYIIGGKDKVSDYECSANKVVPFIPYEGASRVYHTNHPFVNDDQSMYKEMLKKTANQKKGQKPTNSEIRFDSLEKRLKNPSKKVTVETVKSILSSHDHPQHPVCRHKKSTTESMTIGRLIMVLSPNLELHIAPGPPCMTEFKTFRLHSIIFKQK